MYNKFTKKSYIHQDSSKGSSARTSNKSSSDFGKTDVTDVTEKWCSKPFDSIEYYTSIVNGIGLVDVKQSLYYLELVDLFIEAGSAKTSELPEIQRRIDMLFDIVIHKKFATFSPLFAEGLRKFFNSTRSIKTPFDIDINDVSLILLKEFLKVFKSFDGVEELTFRSNVVQLILLKQPELDVRILHELVMLIVSKVIMSCDWWCLGLQKQKNMNVSIILPTPSAFYTLKGEVQLIDIDLPRLYYQECIPTKVLRMSNSNAGNITPSCNILDTVNTLSKTALCVNVEVLDWLESHKDLWIPSLPTFDSLKGLTNGYSVRKIKSVGSSIKLCNNILATASVLKHAKALYYPMFIDWRGRFYSKGEYINYQSHKASLALLKFSKPLPIKSMGILYLKYYGANLYGIGTSNEHRLAWVDEHHQRIMLLDIELISKAKNIPLFAAFCIEYKNCFTSPSPLEFMSALPVMVDCTCNGLQHLAAMVSDVYIAKSVNLSPENTIQDIYQIIAQKITRESKLGFSVTRSMVKKVVMTVPYNATLYSAAEYFISTFNYKPETQTYYPENDESLSLTYKELYNLCSVVYKAFFKIHPQLKSVVEYFKEMAELMTACDCPITWHTPTGLKITQKYVVFDIIKSKGVWQIRDIALKVPTSKIDRRRQREALMPNIIHSFDASNVVKTVDILQKDNIEIFTIHDCFASHAANIHKVQLAVKMGFIKLYVNRDVLAKFHEGCLTNIENHDPSIITLNRDQGIVRLRYSPNDFKTFKIPVIPQLGSFDISKIIESKYMVN